MAFWGRPRLAREIKAQGIVAPFDSRQLDQNSYTLRMGSEYFVTPEPGSSLWKSKKTLLGSQRFYSESRGEWVMVGQTFTIPPGQFAFLLSLESVKIPPNAMGFISLRSGIKFKGLINVSGFHVDPGFEGNLIFSVFNAGPTPMPFQRGDDLFKLWLADLDGQEEEDGIIDDKSVFSSKSPQTSIPGDLISHVSKEVTSIQQVDKRVRSLETSMRIVYAVAGVVVTAVLVASRFIEL